MKHINTLMVDDRGDVGLRMGTVLSISDEELQLQNKHLLYSMRC